MKVSIILPVFNEAKTVHELLERVWNQPLLPEMSKEMIIVESNSKDQTREIVQKFAESKKNDATSQVRVILQNEGKGKGNAVREGLKEATGDIIIIQDGDLEYDVKDYPALLQPLVDGRAKFVLGSRHLSAGSWKIRKFEKDRLTSAFMNVGGVFFHSFFNLTYGQWLTDPTTMYKVFYRSCIDKIHFESDRFDFDFELLGKLIRAGYTPLEVPVSYVSRGFKEGKKVRVVRDPITYVRAILKYRFARLYE